MCFFECAFSIDLFRPGLVKIGAIWPHFFPLNPLHHCRKIPRSGHSHSDSGNSLKIKSILRKTAIPFRRSGLHLQLKTNRFHRDDYSPLRTALLAHRLSFARIADLMIPEHTFSLLTADSLSCPGNGYRNDPFRRVVFIHCNPAILPDAFASVC